MSHEILRVESMTTYHIGEKNGELWIRLESTNLAKVFFRHKKLTS